MTASEPPALQARPSNHRCSNCGAIMSLYTLPGQYGRTVDLDVCLECNAIWFDPWESSQLSPDGVVALFQLIHERGGASSSAGRRLTEGLRCVTCGEVMKLAHDRVKNTRFVYQACPHGHGRFTTFYNFLCEKQFVRELTPAERSKLCATVRQVKCSGCGAPVDLAKSDACEYCRAPVSVFDRDAAKKAIDHYLRERHKHVPTHLPPPNYGHSPQRRHRSWGVWDTLYAADLASDLLWALGRAATRGLSRAAPSTTAGIGAGSVLAQSPLDTSPLGTAGGWTDPLSHAGLGHVTSASAEGALATATDVLFGAGHASSETLASGLSEADPPSSVTQRLSQGEALSQGRASATDTLFDSKASDLIASVSSDAADEASAGLDGLGELGAEAATSLGDDLGEVTAEASEDIVDLVADGLDSLVSSIFE